MINGDEKLRDVSSIALKTAVAELPAATSPLTIAVIKLLVPPLKDALCKSFSVSFLFCQSLY